MLNTDLGQVPRYLMMAETVDHGRTLLYTVEILDLTGIIESTDFGLLRNFFIERKTKGNSGFRLIKEETIKDPSNPFEIKMVFADKHGESLNFACYFVLGSKFYCVETYQVSGSVNFGIKPNKLTRNFFKSFKIKTDANNGSCCTTPK